MRILTLAILTAITFSEVAAETKIVCEAERGSFIAEGSAHQHTETFSVTFDHYSVLNTNRRCDKISVNNVTSDEIHLVCEYSVTCVNDSRPVSETLTINRLTGKYQSWQGCVGLLSWGACQKAENKF